MKKIVFAATALMFVIAAAPMVRADEIDDAVAMFTADDGLTAAEKIPALKAFIEARQDDTRVLPLVSILGALAEEAKDAETRKWAGEVIHRQRNKANAAAATGAALPTGETDDSPVADLPPVKISTPEEIEAGFAAYPPLPPVRNLGAFKTVKPILPDVS